MRLSFGAERLAVLAIAAIALAATGCDGDEPTASTEQIPGGDRVANRYGRPGVHGYLHTIPLTQSGKAISRNSVERGEGPQLQLYALAAREQLRAENRLVEGVVNASYQAVVPLALP